MSGNPTAFYPASPNGKLLVELLSVNRLQVAYGAGEPVLSPVSFAVLPGEAVALVGPSGSGKSSCVSALLGLLNPRSSRVSGEARFQRSDGSSLNLLTAERQELRRIRGREIGLIFQDPAAALNPVLACGRQLREAIVNLRPRHPDPDALMAELLAQVELDDIAPRVLRSRPGKLSGGQLQRLLIAMALAGAPRLLIADEPTTALDSLTEAEIVGLLDRLRRERRMGLLFITHDRRLINRMTDRVIRVGETPEEVGVDAGAQLTPIPAAATRNRIEVNNLRIRFTDAEPDRPAAVACSFSLGAGEWVGLLGRSGCGKSTVAAWLAGLLPADGGSLKVGDQTLSASASPAEIRRLAGVQLIFQDVRGSLNPRMSCLRAVREALPGRTRTAAAELLRKVGLDPQRFGKKLPAELSGGERRRLAIARALAAEPRILVCDEALTGLDPPLRLDILELLRSVCTDRGIGVLFITHDLSLARRCAHRLLLMEAGRIVERGPVWEVLANPRTDLARSLVDTLDLRQG